MSESAEINVLRSGIGFAAKRLENLYHSAEGSSPMLKSTMDRVNEATQWLTKPLIERVVEVSDPIVSSVDSKVSSTVSSVKTYISPALEKVPATLHDHFEMLLDFTDHQIDSWLPEESSKSEEGAEKDGSVKEITLSSVSSKAKRRMKQRAAIQYSRAKELSGGKLKEYLRIDVLEVTEISVLLGVSLSQDLLKHVSSGSNMVREYSLSKQAYFIKLAGESRQALLEKLHSASKAFAESSSDFGFDKIVSSSRKLSFTDITEYAMMKASLKPRTEKLNAVEVHLWSLVSDLLGMFIQVGKAAKSAATRQNKQVKSD